ncbi:putative nwd2 protein [Mycena sanguinolenta]|uniref:Putative nwd2 protein n=1 Tax=Mycena sanguinolenta TaxID=230812 RepID=A0A8H6Z9N4_9AGAR|nr:putative nwd2 protein [Mycena sanguinolenta]
MFPDVQAMNNYINGGRGGVGGEGSGGGTGGAGGHGMGPSLNFDIRSGGDFTITNVEHGERGIDILHRTVASAAIHDSAESYPQPRCHPETRTKMLEGLHKWALDTDSKTAVLWMHGPAGAGKSAMMQTLAHQLKDAGILGASFFFKRDHATCGNAKTLFSTIAYQLALSVLCLRTPISQIVENDPSILLRSIETQIQKLIFEPCRSHQNDDPVAILIDGLDECEGHEIQRKILRAIRNSCSSKHLISLRFIVASRPEPHIREVFDSPFYSDVHRTLNVEQSFDDVHKYLCDEFSRIRTTEYISTPWPSSNVLNELVRRSSGYFIYASTIIKFIDDKNYRPMERLEIIQNGNKTDSEAFDALDQLYMTILCSTPRQSELIPILCAIVNFDLTAPTIDQLFGLADGETRVLLRGLQSVLHVPSNDYDEISSHHASFLDFLDNPNRSKEFCVGSLHRRMELARSVLTLCAGHYREIWALSFSSLTLARRWVSFIISLPPSPELWPLIGRMNPDYIFHPDSDLEGMLTWLRRIPSVPRGLIHLWKDYEYMYSFGDMISGSCGVQQETFFQRWHMFPSPKLLQVLASIAVVGHPKLSLTHTLLDLTWDELRNIICSLRPLTARPLTALPTLHQWVSSEFYPWPFRDVALVYIRRMVRNLATPKKANRKFR